MDLNHVAVFARVVELESFTAAAKQLGLPKSSVSRTVTRLEDELGVRLLQRTTRTLHLTEVGRAYYERARGALSALDEAASAATNSSAEPRGTVRMTAPPDMGIMNLVDIVARFARKYPLVHIDISLSSRFVDLVAEGFDLALRAGKMADSSLVARKIGSDALGIYASANYLRRRGRPKTLADLADHDCVFPRDERQKRMAPDGSRGRRTLDRARSTEHRRDVISPASRDGGYGHRALAERRDAPRRGEWDGPPAGAFAARVLGRWW